MKKLFKKAMTVLGSALMIGATVGMAAAASYPAPFVQSGSADVAIVYGSNAAVSDAAQAGILQGNLATALAAATATGGSSTTATVTGGDAVSLDSGSTKIWLNTSLNTAKTTLTKTDLPKVLGDYTFSGNVDSKITSTITLGSTNKVTFAKQPSSNDDPVIGIALNTNKGAPLYNTTITMPAINFTSSDSTGETIHLYGKDFVVSTASTNSSLVLFSSAQESTLSLGGSNPTSSTVVTIGGTQYTVELVTGSDTTATIAVNGESKEVTEGSSKKIGGIDVAIKSVTSSAAINTVVATLLIGSNKLTFNDASQVLVGSEDNPIDGTYVTYSAGTGTHALTSLDIAVYAPDSSSDAILTGESLTDPVFGSFKVAFSGLSSPLDDANRDIIKIDKSGDKGMTLTMTDSALNTKTFDFVYNISTGPVLGDSNTYRVALQEYANLSENNYTVVGNEDYGHLVQVTRIYNFTGTDYSKDSVTFKDIISGETYSMEATAEGTGRVTIDGRQYTVTYGGSGDTGTLKMKYPTSDSTSTQYVVFPTIETKNGALVQLYEPQTLTFSGNAIGFNLPDGDGYTTALFTFTGATNSTAVNWTASGAGSTAILSNQNEATSVRGTRLTVGQLAYHVNMTGTNTSTITLLNPSTGINVTTPALVVFEAKNDSSNYNAIVTDVESNPAGTSSDPVGVSDTYYTSAFFTAALQSDSDITQEVDLYGTLVTEDSNTASQKIATISYPKGQVYANVFIAESGASISGGTSTGGAVTELGNVIIEDSEVTSVSNKNLIVVGGSCINTVAADLLGSTTPVCSDSFTTLTGVSAGGYLIQSFERTGGKVALLVAGYNAADTVKAVTYLTNNAVMTEAGKKYTGTSATEASLVTTTA